MKAQLAYPLNIREPAEREAVRQTAVREIGAALSSPFASFLLAYALKGKVETQQIDWWLASQLLFAMFNLMLSALLLRRLASTTSRRRILHTLFVTLTLEAIVWGLAPVVLKTPEPIDGVLVLAFVCVASFVAVHTLCLQRPVMLMFISCLMLPSAIMCLMDGQGLELIKGLGACLVLCAGVFYGLLSARLAREGINATVQSAMLADQLKSNNADLRTALRAIRQMATRDPLTQCYNRRALMEFLEREMITQDRGGQPLGVLLLDVDHFKLVNDTHGHLVGDEVLKALANRLNQLMRGNDFLARYGGEEFVCLMHVADEDQLVAAAERVRLAFIDNPIVSRPVPLSIQVSIGAAMRRRGEEANALFARADKALYKAKNTGRNRSVLDAAASSPVQADVNITSAL